MTWASRDFVLRPDGTLEDLGVVEFSDETVAGWGKVFTNLEDGPWYVLVNKPNLVVMRALSGRRDNPRLRFSINTPIEDED